MIDLFLQHWIIYSIIIYLIVVSITFLFTKDINKSLFWFVYILGDLFEVLIEFIG